MMTSSWSIYQPKNLKNNNFGVFGLFGICAGVYQSFRDISFDSLLPLAVTIQCFAYLCLWRDHKSTSGEATEALLLQAALHLLRSAFGAFAAIGAPETGSPLAPQDGLVADLFALVLVLQLFKGSVPMPTGENVHKVASAVVGCFTLALLLRPDVHNSELADIVCGAVLYLDAWAMVPQLFSIRSATKVLLPSTMQFLITTALSKLLSFVFVLVRFKSFDSDDVNVSTWLILIAHVVQLAMAAHVVQLAAANASQADPQQVASRQ